MILIACVDDNLGMAFNGRRQSRDRAVAERIAALTEGKRLWLHPYTAKLFEGGVCADEAFLTQAGEQEFAFTELAAPGFLEERIELIVLYRWNRVYPADVRFDIDLTGWKQLSSTEFTGTSHEKITEEIYTK